MSILNAGKKKKGRPRVDSEEVSARLQRPLLESLESWALVNGIQRSEAIRRLIQKGLEAEVFQKEEQEKTPR